MRGKDVIELDVLDDKGKVIWFAPPIQVFELPAKKQ